MKIRDIQVDGFGVWSGLKLSELSDDLNVFYGPNEAGKTTLMQFVRAMLYGFSPDRRQRYLPPLRPGRPGGVLAATLDGKQFSVSRHADEPGELGDTALVNDGRDVSRDPAALVPLVGEVDEATFSNVFAFGLREIQELGTLSDTKAADELYELALGLDRVSLLDVMKELASSRTRLLAPDDRPSLVAQLVSQRERLQGEIDELAQGTAKYLALASERDKLNAEILRLENEVARFEKQGRELALARSLAERWQRRETIDERLGQLGGFDALPENALARFDQLEARLANRRRRFEKLQASRPRVAKGSRRAGNQRGAGAACAPVWRRWPSSSSGLHRSKRTSASLRPSSWNWRASMRRDQAVRHLGGRGRRTGDLAARLERAARPGQTIAYRAVGSQRCQGSHRHGPRDSRVADAADRRGHRRRASRWADKHIGGSGRARLAIAQARAARSKARPDEPSRN